MLRFRTSVAALTVAALLAFPITASAGTSLENIDKQPAPIAVDAFFLRPMGLVALGASAALFIPMATVTAVTRPGDLGTVWDRMLVQPAKYVFDDPIGSH